MFEQIWLNVRKQARELLYRPNYVEKPVKVDLRPDEDEVIVLY